MKILIVDDDQMVQTVCSAMLRILKHETVVCGSGAEALKQLTARDARFDLLLLDDTMPDMSGRETLEALLSRGIRIPVMICSGRPVDLDNYSNDPSCDPIAQLAKPFTLQMLKTATDKFQSERLTI